MTDYRIRIIVEGDDRASAPLGRVGSALGGIGRIAGGIISAQALMGIARGIIGIGTSAIGATANLQAMEIGMASLAAKEIASTENAKRLAEATKKGLDTSHVSLMKISDALPQAEKKASAMMEELAKIAIVSPYQLQVVQGSYQMAQAFGYSGDEAMKFTKALLNIGAGVGADNERLSRMAYNLAQIRMVGKVTAIDFRQLAMAGFDLGAVLQYAGQQAGLSIKDYNDFNKALASGKITWEQFTDSFMKYAEENFGGASERMSRTLKGLASTFQDLFVLTFPKMLGPAAETFTGFANRILDGFLKIRDSGILENLGEKINDWVKGITEKLSPFVDKFIALIDAFALAGQKPIGGRLGSAFGGLGNAAEEQSSLVRKALANMIGDDNLAAIIKVSDSFKRLADAARPFFTQVASFLGGNVKLSDVLMAIGAIIATTVIPSLLSAAAAFIPFLALVGLIALVRNAWQNNWLGMRDTLTQAWHSSIYPALQQLWAWLQVNIPLALQAMSTLWYTTLLPALQTAWAWIQTNLLPILAQLWAWLQTNLPIAIQALANFWNTALLPALQAAWSWIQTSLIPALSQLWTWLSTNVPQAIQALSNFWTSTLLPAIHGVISFMQGVAIPFWESVANLLSAVVGKSVEALAGLWQNVLSPALKTVGDVLNATIVPLLEKVWSLIAEKLHPATEKLGGILSGAFKRAWDGIVSAIKTVTDWIGRLADKIANLKLPKWLTPGSPTPFEIGLMGISQALADVNRIMQPTFAFQTGYGNNSFVPAPEPAGGDIFIEQNFYDAGAAAIGMAEVATLRRRRLGMSMGA